MNEKDLRKKIRSELEYEHRSNKKTVKKEKQVEEDPVQENLDTEDKYLSEAIIQSLEHEICSELPEMVECENHLGEVKWLTPLELHNEFEFYPVEESWFHKFKTKLFGLPKLQIPSSEYWQNYASEQRQKIEEDVHDRISLFREKQVELQRQEKKNVEARIYAEELDKFYGAKKGYKKYKNHLGESRWMTKAEADQQDEFFEEDPLVTTEWMKRSAIFLFFVIIIAGWWFWNQSKKVDIPKAWLIVELNEDRGNLYINQTLAAGFKANTPYPITAGAHEVSLIRDGYVAVPRTLQINVAESDTIKVKFTLEKQHAVKIGFVKIVTNDINGNIYVNDEFYGNLAEQSFLSLDEGSHSIRVEKKGYYAYPYAENIQLEAGDTNQVYFELRRRNDPVADDIASGLIEVRSNIKNADIYLNGKKTEYKTDYIIQRVPFGQYAVSLVKEGYKIYPDEQVVRINKNESRALADFTLSSTTANVEIKTKPVNGEIFINGKSVGSGVFKGSLPLGNHVVSFGDIAYYTNPGQQNIKVNSEDENRYVFNYNVDYQIEFSPSGSEPLRLNGTIIRGYFFNLPEFVDDPGNGPEVKNITSINENVWYLNYAFQYRNPPGSDAILFEFDIPDHIDLYQKLRLKVWGYRTSNNYPLAVRGNSIYQIIVNNNTFQSRITPRNSIKNISENNFDAFDVNEYLKRGRNTILISTTNETSAEFVLWKIRIE